MSKERLEEIKKEYKKDMYDCRLGRFDIQWLIEQAEQEHVTSVQNTKLAVEFERLQLENKRYRDVIEEAREYANSPKILTAPAGIEKILTKALESESNDQ